MPTRWQKFQNRTGWPWGPWGTVVVIVIGFAVVNLAVVGAFHVVMEVMQ